MSLSTAATPFVAAVPTDAPPAPVVTPRRVYVYAFQVTGLSVRTCNRDEADPAAARIGPLWDRFFSQSWERHLPAPGQDGRLFGVYSAYESDAQGAFDVTAGVATQPVAEPAAGPAAAEDATTGVRVVPVQAGPYLVFTGEGPMPHLVVDTWGAIWRYFADNPQVQRRYGTDFEAYSGPEQVAIHIGIVDNR
ncbi:GyrI-like domain-containing protein [Paracidovorax sp. MALMAid1276]|uniref:GyrI-like domain-containing protein n=1 Tax=Paracidovorax sp. MALMAid1276 TaxID=3411631 RepID=UPI003B9C4FBE